MTSKDGRFDKADKAIIFKSGVWAPTIDVNGDGRKDIADAFALLLLQSKRPLSPCFPPVTE